MAMKDATVCVGESRPKSEEDVSHRRRGDLQCVVAVAEGMELGGSEEHRWIAPRAHRRQTY
jgi:hypothetical protein